MRKRIYCALKPRFNSSLFIPSAAVQEENVSLSVSLPSRALFSISVIGSCLNVSKSHSLLISSQCEHVRAL